LLFDDAAGSSGETMLFRLRDLIARAAGVVLFVAAPVVFAQDSPTTGKTLFEGNAIQACTACHATVENRRQAIDPGGDLDFDFVLATFLNAIATVTEMNKFNPLTTQQKRNIAAYIADVPKARPDQVAFNASNISIETGAQTITFTNAVTATAPLTITSIGLTGSSADFLIKTAGTTCASNNQVLAAGASCNVSVSFMTSTGAAKVAFLNFPYSQSGVNTTRTAQLNGTVAGQQPPPSNAQPSGGSGALGLGWAGLLALAVGLRRRN
jgi:hypothetical protein